MARSKSAPDNPSPPVIHSLIATLTNSVDSQSVCRIFSIPYNIRLEIYRLALRQYDDETRLYPEHAFRSRPPPSRYRQRICTDLLITCKRVYMEAHDIALAVNPHTFWDASGDVLNERGYPDTKKYLRDDLSWCFHKYTVEQRAAITDVRLFVSKDWLNSPQFQMFCQLKDIAPKRLRITIRPTEWDPQINGMINLDHAWMDNFKYVGRLKNLQLEMQTVEANSDQLETTVQDLLKKSILLAGSRSLGEVSVTRDRYMGHGIFEPGWEWINAVYYSQEENRWKAAEPGSRSPYQIQYVSTTVEWRMQ
ncbi:hypothetical protein JR316_0007422 [Psilocybe cubensis]|uniref:Uncharacterized protein n=2 Tax=Psilocybe cubensis TaxID=181762 RepID=A0A8H7XQQ6_PSICU|nr:hypothetical protein JR316_0007422 [Psilocybe cubensis]KAH9480821.1 hypothetical protein JR316_0007422 [Psilocybe cubensis]